MLALLLALALQGTDDRTPADHAERLLRAAHPEQVDLVGHTYAGRCLRAVTSLEVGGGRELLLVATETDDAEGGCDPLLSHGDHSWRLELVQGTPARARLVAAVEAGESDEYGGVQVGLTRVSEKPLLFAVHWGISNESDGSCSSRDLWRLRGAVLERLLPLPSCNLGDGPDGGSSSYEFSAAPADSGEVRIEAWHDQDEYGEHEPGWRARTIGTYLVGERSVRVTRALAVPSTSSTLPPSKARDYRPERAVDGDPRTAWCEGTRGRVWASPSRSPSTRRWP